jgi:hypothetical protein
LVNTVILLDSEIDVRIFNNRKSKIVQPKIFSYSIHSYKILEKEKLQYEIAENYLTYDDQLKLFDLTLKLADRWYDDIPFSKELEFENVNLLGIVDTGELLNYFVRTLKNFLITKRIIEKENPQKIIVPITLLTTVKSLIKKDIELEILNNNVSKTHLYWDKIEIKFNIGRFPISFHLSRSAYNKMKKIFESVISTVLNLGFSLENKNKTILLLEFNPAAYENLLSDLSKQDSNVILLNRRRPAFWNLQSIKTLRDSNCKVLNFENILNHDERQKAYLLSKQYLEKLEKIWNDEDYLTKLFSLEGDSFWLVIKDVLMSMYKTRLSEYVTLLLSVKKLFERINVTSILCLNEAGETEKAILKINKNKVPSILLQHAFDNLTPVLAKYDPLKIIPLICQKIDVYGNIQKKYLIEQQKIDVNRILVTGSPRHDIFFKKERKKISRSEKILLLTPLPINEYAPHTIDLYIKYEKLIKNYYEIVKKMTNVKTIVKLHPSQEENNEDIKKLFKEIDPMIPIYQITPIMELIDMCDALVNINPESYDTSTIIMESLIRDKPTMTIFLDDQYHDMEFVKEKATLVLSEKSDLEKNLNDILFNEEIRNNLIQNARQHLKNYLSNHGTASENLAHIMFSVK